MELEEQVSLQSDNSYQSIEEEMEESILDFDEDYKQRLEFLRKQKDGKEDDKNSLPQEENLENDLDLLNQKFKLQDERQQKRDMENQKKQEKKNNKKTSVNFDLIKTTIILEIIRLLEQTKLIDDENYIAEVLSYFSTQMFATIESKLKAEQSLKNQLLVLLMNFQLVFTVNKLTPQKYILYFAALCLHYCLNVRIVKAIDLQFIGLEAKFKVKCLEKIDDDNEEPLQQSKNENLSKSIVQKTQQIFSNNQNFSDQPKDLNQFAYEPKPKPIQVVDIQQFEYSKSSDFDQKLEKFNSEKDNQGFQIKKKMKEFKLNSKKFNEKLYQQNQNLWLEVYDKDSKKWLTIDPISDIVILLDFLNFQNLTFDPVKIKMKIHNTCSLFILTTQQIYFKDKFYEDLIINPRKFENNYILDLTWKYCIKYKLVRLQLSCEKWFNDLTNSQSKFQSLTYILLDLIYHGPTNLLHTWNRELVESDRQQYQEWCLKNLPLNEKEVKYHPLITLKSVLTQYQMIHPDAQPVPDLYFNGEQAYFKKDIIILHSKNKWRTFLREVKKEEIEHPIKEITGKFKKNNGTPSAVYGIWQTIPLQVSAEQELPKNDYDNYELFAYPPPRGTVLFRKLGIKQVLQKNQIRFVEAVDGFDKKSSKMFAAKCGYLIYKEDEEKVIKLYSEFKEQQLSRNKINKKKELKSLWTQFFKAILIKKQIQEKYQQNQT